MRLIPRKTRLIIYNTLCSAQIRRRDDRAAFNPFSSVPSTWLRWYARTGNRRSEMLTIFIPIAELGKIGTRSGNIEMRLRF
jgi:hypothetical protein